MPPHTLVGGAQTTLTATASARADRRDWPSEAWGPRDKTRTPPLGALDRRTGGTEAVSTGPKCLIPLNGISGKGVKQLHTSVGTMWCSCSCPADSTPICMGCVTVKALQPVRDDCVGGLALAGGFINTFVFYMPSFFICHVPSLVASPPEQVSTVW
jgi:hypothetical protein